MNLYGEHSEWFLASGHTSRVGADTNIMFSVRLQAVLLQETGVSRRYSSGCSVI